MSMDYRVRRQSLHQRLGGDDGVILWLGGTLSPRNYPDNPYLPFRQDSHFLYYVGLAEPGLAALSYPDGREILFGTPVDINAVVWEGERPSLAERAAQAGMTEHADIASLKEHLEPLDEVLYLPPFQDSALLALSELLGCSPTICLSQVSEALVEAVVAQRLVKSDAEVAALEEALTVTASMFHEAMRLSRPGLPIASLLAQMTLRVRERLWDFSFPPICTDRGDILHNHHYDGAFSDGRLLLLDMGVEAPAGYASDITRTWPVNGVFSSRQKALYEVVLQAQLDAIAAVRPGVNNRDIHLTAARTIAQGLKDLGLMQGNVDDAVAAGAHALFFPHGIGHALGVDVHDMEDLGDVVGYPGGASRSEQFGLSFLRFARPLAEGHVITIEPGVYFIPALIELWQEEGKHREFVRYDALDATLDFGGIRIEDDVLVTQEGGRILGPPIAKTVVEVEAVWAS